ncbi:unnamed protein product [Lactuca saligna]|uniref:Uncharacterized protein n=1 Tax=Lactuca saligna TaxID=75948 RepID=A0AA35UY61_LACSI|nr:unnamed protein product [Lactuca saligna]
MALVTHQVQDVYAPSRPSWKKGTKLTQNSKAFCTFQKIDITLYLNSVGPSFIHGSKRKSLRVSSFESSNQGDEYLDRVRGSKWAKSPYISSNGGLTSLPTSSPSQDRTLEGHSCNERVETDHEIMKCGILKRIWCNFLSLDAKIKIPMIIFIPLFLTVNIKYGAHVTKELIPLWIGGPLLLALYIKIVHVIYSLYVFSFKQSVKLVNNFGHGRIHLWQQFVYFRNLDYKDESKRMWKEFQEWFGDMCMEFVESMWSYRRTVGFLKMTKII